MRRGWDAAIDWSTKDPSEMPSTEKLPNLEGCWLSLAWALEAGPVVSPTPGLFPGDVQGVAVPVETGGDPGPGAVHHLPVSFFAFPVPGCSIEASERMECNGFKLQSVLSHVLR